MSQDIVPEDKCIEATLSPARPATEVLSRPVNSSCLSRVPAPGTFHNSSTALCSGLLGRLLLAHTCRLPAVSSLGGEKQTCKRASPYTDTELSRRGSGRETHSHAMSKLSQPPKVSAASPGTSRARRVNSSGMHSSPRHADAQPEQTQSLEAWQDRKPG